MIGEKLGSFRIEAILGTGAMGVVYRAVHDPSGRTAAVKVISGEVAQKGKTADRFDREAKILQQFRHPNIVRFYAVGRYRGTSYFAMEFVQGPTLEQFLAERGPLPWREVVDIGIQVCEALHYAHEHGVVHRDLKPSNLMVTDKGQIKLTDFGIAKDLDATTALTATGRTLGTAAYMAPEQIRGNPPVSHKTDLYSLGVVLYQLLTGRLPFEGPTPVVMMHNHLNEPPPRASAKVAEIPKALDGLIVKLMSKTPADRPWDAAAVAQTLTELRDKASRAESIPMVWPTQADGTVTPHRLGAETVTEGPKKTRKTAKTATTGFVFPEINRARLEVALLVLGLIVTGGGIAYVVLPPGEKYLHRHAEALMASKERGDWMTARDEYIEPLDRRFPNHKYREQTQGWLDQIRLLDADRRSAKLDSPVRVALNEPQTASEHQYIAFSKLARDSSEKGDDFKAIRQWQEFANLLKPEDKEERGWYLLARKRAADLEKAVVTRRQAVLTQLQHAAQKQSAGQFEEAASILQNLRKQYGDHKDLADLIPPEPSTPKPESVAPAAEPKGAARAEPDRS